MRTSLFCTLITTLVYGLFTGFQVLLNPFKESLAEKASAAASKRKSFFLFYIQCRIIENKRKDANWNSIGLRRLYNKLDISTALISHTIYGTKTNFKYLA